MNTRYDNAVFGTTGLVGYWPLDEDSGNAIDYVAARNATVTNFTRRVAGPGEGLSYEGSGSPTSIIVPHNAAFNLNVFMWELWMRPPSGGDQTLLVSKPGTDNYSLTAYANGTLEGQITSAAGGGGTTTLTIPGALRNQEWHMIHFGYVSPFLTIYVNGLLWGALARTGATIATNTATLRLQDGNIAANEMTGRLSRVAFYNQFISLDDMKARYKLGLWQPPRPRSGRPRQSAMKWELCDRAGTRLASIDQRTGAEVNLVQNGQRNAYCVASLEDRFAKYVSAFDTSLKVWLGGELIFFGPVTAPRFIGTGGEAGGLGGGSVGGRTVELNALDVTERLARGYTKGLADSKQVDQSTILWNAIAHLNTRAGTYGGPDTGIIRGSTPLSYRRDRHYPDGTNVFEALVNMSEVSNGPDFEFQPLDRTDGVYAQFNTFWPYQGFDRTDDVILEYNVGKMNVGSCTIDEGAGEIINFAIFAGQGEEGKRLPAYIAWHPASIAKYGIYEHFEALPDVKTTEVLQEYAEQLVGARAEPINFIDITPAVEAGGTAYGYQRDAYGQWQNNGEGFGIPPQFGPPLLGDYTGGGEREESQYWLGDVVKIVARDKNINYSGVARVTEAKLAEVDDAGTVAVTLTLVPTVNIDGVSGSATTVSTEDFS